MSCYPINTASRLINQVDYYFFFSLAQRAWAAFLAFLRFFFWPPARPIIEAPWLMIQLSESTSPQW